jgi:hypothetical protein
MSRITDGRSRMQALVAAVLCASLGLLAWWRPMPMPSTPPRIPASAAEPWMADCLPGVGAKTRDRTAAAIRGRRPEELPRRAREEAQDLFDWGR